MTAVGSFSSDRHVPGARGLSASLRKRTCANSQRYVCFVPFATERSAAKSTAYSITSSARSRNDSGIFRPRAFAVLTLTTSSNLVGCSTGRSDGFAPCRIRENVLAGGLMSYGASLPDLVRRGAIYAHKIIRSTGSRQPSARSGSRHHSAHCSKLPSGRDVDVKCVTQDAQ